MNTIITPQKLTTSALAIALGLLAAFTSNAAPTNAASKAGESSGLAAALLAAGHARATADTTSAIPAKPGMCSAARRSASTVATVADTKARNDAV